MVIRLEKPDIHELELIENVLAERQNGRNAQFFEGISNDWKQRISEYLAHHGNPEHLNPWSVVTPRDIGNRFRNLYSSPQEESAQGPVLQSLRSREIDFCPACGEDGTPNTLDHYLPKGKYPEFSITAANLFPMCDICQGEKLEKTLSEDGSRLFLHPYFDNFLSSQVVFLEIGEPYDSPGLMILKVNPNLPPDASAVVERHLIELNIHARYYHFFRTNYIRLLRLASRAREKDQNIPDLIEQFRDNALDKTVNSWGHVFYDGVLRNQNLLDYLSTFELPAV